MSTQAASFETAAETAWSGARLHPAAFERQRSSSTTRRATGSRDPGASTPPRGRA